MEYSEENENQIVKDILKGQEEKFRILVDRYSPMVFMVVRGFLNDEEDVEELAQQIFVKTYIRLSSFKGKSRFSTWLYSLALNHCRDYAKNIRRQNKNFSEMEEHELDTYMTYEETPEQKLEAIEWKQILHEALDHITPEYAEAFLLKYRDDVTYKAMSKRLGASVSALKLRVFRARNELKEFIENKR